MITPAQIRAARALKGWGQLELAERARLTQVTVGKIESERSRGAAESITAIVAALEDGGVEFVDGGVRLSQNSIRLIEGKDAALRMLDDVFFSSRNEGPKAEVLFFGADERRSSSEVMNLFRRIRRIGVAFRSLISEDISFFRGPLEEYRLVPRDVVSGDAVTIYGDKVAFITDTKPHYNVLIIRNAQLHNDHRRIFDYFWHTGVRPNKTTAKVKERYT